MKTLAVICFVLCTCTHWTVGEPFSDNQLLEKNTLRGILNRVALLQGTSDHPVPPPPGGMTTTELFSQSASEETNIQAFSVPFGIRSTGWTPKIKICFHNQRSGSVNVYWINYRGSLVRYSTLRPNRRYCQLTFGTHPWYISTVSGTPLEIVIPYHANMDVNIKNKASWY